MCELIVKTRYLTYKVIHPMRNQSNGEDYALDVFPMAGHARLSTAGIFDNVYLSWYDMYLDGKWLGVSVGVPSAA